MIGAVPLVTRLMAYTILEELLTFLTEADPIQRILIHNGETKILPQIVPAHAPPDGLETDGHDAGL